RCLQAGANDYIAKPIDVDKLVSLCRVWWLAAMNRERCLQAGANDYIAKPIDVDKLVSLCRVWWLAAMN
ncbi:hypothetical protein C7E12_23440, partial [Stenotrophomonas maltophilia]